MVPGRRIASGAVLCVLAALHLLLLWPGTASADVTAPGCAVTGYTPTSTAEFTELRGKLAKQPVHEQGGVHLDRVDTWVVPKRSQPVVVVDSVEPLTRGDVRAFLFGVDIPVGSGQGTPTQRYVSGVTMPHLGPTIRVIGLRGTSNVCSGELLVAVERSVFTTLVGRVGVALAVIGGLLMVFVARRRRGGWLRRAAFAAPFGLVAGAGEAAVLHEAGVFSPFTRASWWVPVAGLVLAVVLPLTRVRRRAPSPAAEPPPTTHGRFRLDQLLGRTAVAALYRATDTVDGERALVKIPLPERAAEAGPRLAHEAEIVSRLDHPNCVRLKGFESGDTLVLDDVDAVTARAVLDQRGPLTGPQAVTVLAGALGGLGAVHALGLVHRDVRPDNLLLAADERVLLANFELAEPGEANAASVEGTPPYLSPEHLHGEAIDARADVWACGAVLAELLTGAVPVDADGHLLLPTGAAELPEEIVALVTRTMANDPADRPQSTDELLDELRTAAGAAYGPDWASLGALTGAVVLPGGIVAATAAGLAGTAAVTGGATATGTTIVVETTGIGTAAATGGTVTASAATAGAAAPLAGAGAPLTGAAPPLAATATPLAGKVGTIVTSLAAVATVAAIGIAAVLVDPKPAGATQSEVITPEIARVIFVTTINEGRAGNVSHVAEPMQRVMRNAVRGVFVSPEAKLDNVVVGVPPGQRGYPAHFVGSAQVRRPDGSTSYLFCRFDRPAADKPWQLTWMSFFGAPVVPKLDAEGYLAPPPAPADLIIDPAALPERYIDWLKRADAANATGTDPLLTNRASSSFLRGLGDSDHFQGDRRTSSFAYTYRAVGVDPYQVLLVDGTVHVIFRLVVHQTYFNLPGFALGTCARHRLEWKGVLPAFYRKIDTDWIIAVEAWVPVKGLAPPPPPSPAPSRTPAPTPAPTPSVPPAEAPPAPVDPNRVVIEDWSWTHANVATVPC